RGASGGRLQTAPHPRPPAQARQARASPFSDTCAAACVRPLWGQYTRQKRKKEAPFRMLLCNTSERLLLVVLLVRYEQRTDGQGDLLLLVVDVDDLRVNLLANLEDVLGLGDAVIRDLGDVDQAVHARNDLSE